MLRFCAPGPPPENRLPQEAGTGKRSWLSPVGSVGGQKPHGRRAKPRPLRRRRRHRPPRHGLGAKRRPSARQSNGC
eukprot:2214889-Alexandrium_andersonii.AAC.1